MAKDYLSVVYDETRTPRTDYPNQLAKYLFDRYQIKQGARLLEIGCGRGEFLEAFHLLGLDCDGVDLCESSLELSRQFKIQKVDISCEQLPFADNSFDVVYHKSLIEHVYSPQNLMKETLRVLKPGGLVIFLTPDWVSQMKVFYEDFTHSRPYDCTSVLDVLTIFGFSNAEAELFCQLPVLWEHPVLKGVSRIMRVFISTPLGRRLTRWTGIKFFRWSVELMVLGSGRKQETP